MNELILIRHGEARHHIDGGAGGWSDDPLTLLGREQARRTGAWLKDNAPFAPAAILGSDLPRANETAELIGAALGLAVEPTPALREINNGAASRMSRVQARAVEAPRTEPVLDWIPHVGGESWRMMHTRVAAFLAAQRAAGRDRLILVSHGGPTICAINWFLGLERDEDLRDVGYGVRPCGITHLRRDADGGRILALLSDTRHLA